MRKIVMFLFLTVLILSVFAAHAGGFDLVINDVSGLDEPWPLTSSLAFPRGEIRDPSTIRIMSGGKEIPSQVDVTATWRDGSIRWALAGFTASPRGKYRVEYGEGIRRSAHPAPLKVTTQNGNITVDTGAAVFLLESDKLLPEKAWLATGTGSIPILEGSGGGVYLLDNSGRTAKVSGPEAQITNSILKNGPARFVVKRSGWYVTPTGEKLARAALWLYFSAGSPYVKITHSLILTGDTNKVWFKDYGIEFKTPAPPTETYCAAGMPGKESIIKARGKEVFLLQDIYPHFAEREYKAGIGISANGSESIVEKFNVAGDWAYGNYGNYGISIVMPWLAERFPKEISFGERGARAVLWSGRSGRELDFRSKTLVDEYWQTWAKAAPGKPANPYSIESNAQGTALTHDIWFIPRPGGYEEAAVRKISIAAARPPLAMCDPARICSSEVLGWPSYHRDTKKFPEAEKMISDCWDSLLLSMKAFPMTGVISWGCLPDASYVTVNGRIMPALGDSRLKGIMDYGLRRVPFLMYARSGLRECYEYGYRFSRFTGDYGIAHWNSPNKQRGIFIIGDRGGLPFFWQGKTAPYSTIDGEIRHWLNDYYLTGDERSLDLIMLVKEGVAKTGKPAHSLISASRTLLTLAVLDWDDKMVEMSREFIHRTIDLKSQNGISTISGPAEYKDERNTYDLLEYYLETGDETVKEAWLKLLDQKYRFERRSGPISHRNYDAMTYCMAYMITGEHRWRSVAEQVLGDAIYYSSVKPFGKELSRFSANPLEWKSLPPNVWNEYENPFIGFPAALKLIAEKGWSGKPASPLAVKAIPVPESMLLFGHENGRDTKLSIFIQANSEDINPEIFLYRDYPSMKPVQGVKKEVERRMLKKNSYHAYVTLPSEKETGLYLLSVPSGSTFTLLDATAEKAAIFSPEGFWSVARTTHGAGAESSRPGDGRKMFFRVPKGLDNLEIFMGYPAEIKRSDGSRALANSDSNVGRFSLPVNGKAGIWCIEPHIRSFKGESPAGFYRLLNVEPVMSYGHPGLLPDETGGRPVNVNFSDMADYRPGDRMEFLPGTDGKGISLSGNKRLRFHRGEKVEAGGYSRFPREKGTVEFWFKPGRSILDMPLVSFQDKSFIFVQGPHIILQHAYWRRGTPGPYSFIQSRLITDKGPSFLGFQSEYFPVRGQWMHLAYTWDLKENSFSIFLNGHKMPYKVAMYGLNQPAKQQKLSLSESEEYIILGPFDGTMDNLRISDIVRYSDNFVPGRKAPETDANTRAIFLFEGNTRGVSAFSSGTLEAKE